MVQFTEGVIAAGGPVVVCPAQYYRVEALDQVRLAVRSVLSDDVREMTLMFNQRSTAGLHQSYEVSFSILLFVSGAQRVGSEVKPQEIKTRLLAVDDIEGVPDACLGLIELQAQGRQKYSGGLLALEDCPLVMVEDYQIVGVPNRDGLVWDVFHPRLHPWRYARSDVAFQAMQRDIGQQRADHTTLGDSFPCFGVLCTVEDPDLKPSSDETVDRGDTPELTQEHCMVDSVEAGTDICIQNELATWVVTNAAENGLRRICGASSGAEPVTVGLEHRFPFWLQYEFDPGLLGSVAHGGDGERTLFILAGFPNPDAFQWSPGRCQVQRFREPETTRGAE